MMKFSKKIILTMFTFLSLLTLSGCSDLNNYFKDFEEDWTGITMEVQTYDENSQLIDRMTGKDMAITRNREFDSVDSEGYSNSDSQVLKISIGHNTIDHVGSSLIAKEEGLYDVFEDYRKTVDFTNRDSSIPVINFMVNNFKEQFTGKSRILLIRSQNGTPLATYAGNNISMHKSDVPKTTEFLIDGKRLVVYRCDYTIYDTELLKWTNGISIFIL